MNSFKKNSKTFLKFTTLFILVILINMPIFTYALPENKVSEQALENMLDNLYANMSPQEQEEFARQIEIQQQKIMQMTPEERDNYEQTMIAELDQLMATTPELFEKPQASFPNPEAPKLTLPDTEKTISEPDDFSTSTTKSVAKPKPITISQELKDQARKIIRSILQACDTILLKTNHMHDIMHPSWNKGKWLNLKTDLQNLKSYLPMALNSNKVLAELLSPSEANIMRHLKDFEHLIVQLANELKTPDAMGLITITANQPQVTNQALYTEAVAKLKIIIDQLSQRLAQTKLLSDLKSLIDKHAPEQLKAATKKVKKPNASKPNLASTCKSLDQAELKNQAQTLITQLTSSINPQLLTLLVQYQEMPSDSLRRKLQWKLSELEVHLEKLIKLTNISASLNCSSELNQLLSILDYALLDQIVATLNLINTNDLSNELLALHTQLRKFVTQEFAVPASPIQPTVRPPVY